MADKALKITTAQHVFKNHYAKLGESFHMNLSVVVSELYSSSLISPGTRDKASDASSPTHDRAVGVLNDVEGRLKSSEQVFEKFLNVLSYQTIDLGHIAEPMRLQYQRLCVREESNDYPKTDKDKSDLVTGNETNCIVAPDGEYSQGGLRRVAGERFEDKTTQETRPNHLQLQTFSGPVLQDLNLVSTSQDSSPKLTSDKKPFEIGPCTSKEAEDVRMSVEASHPSFHDTAVELRMNEVKRAINMYMKSVQEKSDHEINEKRLECEQKIGNVKKDLEAKCDTLRARMGKVQEGLSIAVSVLTEKNQEQEEAICKSEREYTELSQQLTTKSDEIERLRKNLAERETELEKLKNVMDLKGQELEQLRSCKGMPVKVLSPTLFKANLTIYESQITLWDEAQNILDKFCKCLPENIPSVERELKTKIEQITNLKKRRWTTL